MIPRKATILLVLAVVTPILIPSVTATASWSLALEDASRDADAPDRFTLTLSTGADAPDGLARVTSHVNFTSADGARDAWHEDHGLLDVAPGSVLHVPVHASRGPGTYHVDVVAVAPAGTGAVRDVLLAHDEEGAEGRLVMEVPDAATTLAFTRDGVNDAGKTKTPRSDLITRVVVEDGNGLNDLALAFTYNRLHADGSRVPVAEERFTRLDDGDRNVTSANVESRFSVSPMAAGAYVENVSVVDAHGRVLAGLERDFHVTDTRPFLADAPPLAEEAVTPDRARVLSAQVLVADQNYGTGPLDPGSVTGLGLVEARLYWWSRTVTDPGWSVVIGDPAQGEDVTRVDLRDVGHRDGTYAYEVVDEAGALAIPVRVKVPANAPPGDYRVTLLHADGPDADTVRLGSLPFTITSLPRVSDVHVDADPAPGSPLPVRVVVADAPAATLTLRLLDPDGHVVASASAQDAEGEVPLTLDLPRTLTAGEFVLEARAAALPDSPAPEDGPGLLTRALPVNPGPPRLEMDAGGGDLRAGPRTPAQFSLHAWNFTPGNVTFRLEDARGDVTDASKHVTHEGGDAYAFHARGLRPGAFTLHAQADAPDGARVTASAPVRVDAWLGVRLPAEPARLAADADGRLTGALDLSADGNVPVQRVLVMVGPFPDGRAVAGTVHVEDAAGDARASAELNGGRALLGGGLLDAGETGPRLVVTLDAPPGLDAGEHELPVRVLIVPGGGAP